MFRWKNRYGVYDLASVIILVSLRNRGRKKRTANRMRVATRLLLACFVVIFININVFWSFTKRSV